MEAQELFQIGETGTDDDEVGFDDTRNSVNKMYMVLVCVLYAHEDDG